MKKILIMFYVFVFSIILFLVYVFFFNDENKVEIEEISEEKLISVINNGEVISHYKKRFNISNIQAKFDENGTLMINFEDENEIMCGWLKKNNTTIINCEEQAFICGEEMPEYERVFLNYLPYIISEATTSYEILKPHLNLSEVGTVQNIFPIFNKNMIYTGEEMFEYGVTYFEEEDNTCNDGIKRYGINFTMDNSVAKYLLDYYTK